MPRQLHEKACAHIERHFHEDDLDVETLAHALNVSRATLYRGLRKTDGVARHIRQIRLDAACACLKAQPGLTLTEVLYAYGFSSERQFQRAFQARYGMSPSSWRRAFRDGHDV